MAEFPRAFSLALRGRDGSVRSFASGAGPDLFIISPGDFLRYSNGGVLLDLTPFMEQSTRDDFLPSVIANRMVDGKIYGLPYEVEPMAMYYSVDAFNEVGLTEKEIPKTWEDLLSVAKELTNSERYGVLFETNPGYYQNFTWYPFLWEAGDDFQTKDGKSAFNTPATISALKFWQDAINTGVAPRKPLGGGAWDSVPNLGSGYCAMQNTGVWAIAQLREGAPDFSMACSSCRLPQAANISPSAAAGRSSPTPRDGIRRPPASSLPGRWVR
ncbi:MAG: extracellular solute-binding protein [Roseiarcus sp.]